MTGQAAGLDDDHVVVADLGYGDSGKGTVVDWLCARRGKGTVVRFNGGAQAAHNVVTPDGRHHTFAQFGAGMFTPGVRTHLSRFVLVDPLALAAEAASLAAAGVAGPLDRLTVDRDALLTTPYHRAANRARERARGAGRHGSCGMGIGETARYALAFPADAPRAGDCATPRVLARKLGLLRDRLRAELSTAAPGQGPVRRDDRVWRNDRVWRSDRAWRDDEVPPVADACAAFGAFAARVRLVDDAYLASLLRAGPVVFEGAQGVLLDEWHGFHPYTTWSTTTYANAQALLAEAGQAAARLAVIRCYLTRHGPGPLVTEDPTLELPDRHNRLNAWQGAFRTGHFDAVALRYALEVAGGADAIALTHLDAAGSGRLQCCDRYESDGVAITRLPVSVDHDLARQERLTRLLLRARPWYRAAGGSWSAADWPGLVEDALGCPVSLLSYGPTARDKVVVPGGPGPGRRAVAGRRGAVAGRPGPRRYGLRSTTTGA